MSPAARTGAEEDVQRRIPDVESLVSALDSNDYLADILSLIHI